MPRVNIRGVEHFYKLTSPVLDSSSPVLVFIHGWLLSCNYWHPLVEKLSSRYQCLIYDLRGFGDSVAVSELSFTEEKRLNSPQANDCFPDRGNCSYNLSSYAHDLGILLAQLKIERAWLIGHSLGGSIALWGADVLQNQVKGVICVNAGGGIYLKEEFERFRNAGQNLVKFRPGWLSIIPFLDLLFARAMVARPLPRYWGRQRLIDFLKASQEAAIGSLLHSTTEQEVHLLPEIVSRLSQPVYFLAGKQDTIMETKYVRHLASFHSLFQQNHHNVREIPDCGHLAMLEQTELVADTILKIVTKYHSPN